MKVKIKHCSGIYIGILCLAGNAIAEPLGCEKYVYDASGNITEKYIDGKITKMSYDSSNRILEQQGSDNSKKTTNYDLAGRPICIKDENNQHVRSLGYGYGDKVIEASDSGKKANLYYNAVGQLVACSAKNGLETFAWDGIALISRGPNAFTNEDHFVGGVPALMGDEIVVVDHLGTTLSSGSGKYEYSAYGEGKKDGLYTGKPYVEELGGYCFLYRTLQPEIGKWATQDPSGFPDGVNAFAYADGNPVSSYDSMGLCTMKGPWVSYSTPGNVNDVGDTNPPSPDSSHTGVTTTTKARKWTFVQWEETTPNLYNSVSHVNNSCVGTELDSQRSYTSGTSQTVNLGVEGTWGAYKFTGSVEGTTSAAMTISLTGKMQPAGGGYPYLKVAVGLPSGTEATYSQGWYRNTISPDTYVSIPDGPWIKAGSVSTATATTKKLEEIGNLWFKGES